ncbi:hypothetical protein PBI_CHIDIEBERE_4 [Gordonia phage Chidiebere]|uniref:Uncharacterized protein n=1 Tax=Gordonia phage Chidiebere TaxID=2656530 RepID=A0A649VKH4_9CAUD|nr:hypothetical protein PQD14_gp004 [Gordonia phage Chidiebere]QGJ92896.1 hypothetical protein PBI_CHIDIEBERE_4 [Gordonia phage Chidiebere]
MGKRSRDRKRYERGIEEMERRSKEQLAEHRKREQEQNVTARMLTDSDIISQIPIAEPHSFVDMGKVDPPYQHSTPASGGYGLFQQMPGTWNGDPKDNRVYVNDKTKEASIGGMTIRTDTNLPPGSSIGLPNIAGSINPVIDSANKLEGQIQAMRELIISQQQQITELREEVEMLKRRSGGPISRKRGTKPQ